VRWGRRSWCPDGCWSVPSWIRPPGAPSAMCSIPRSGSCGVSGPSATAGRGALLIASTRGPSRAAAPARDRSSPRSRSWLKRAPEGTCPVRRARLPDETNLNVTALVGSTQRTLMEDAGAYLVVVQRGEAATHARLTTRPWGGHRHLGPAIRRSSRDQHAEGPRDGIGGGGIGADRLRPRGAP
jgi:hypothetical protein